MERIRAWIRAWRYPEGESEEQNTRRGDTVAAGILLLLAGLIVSAALLSGGCDHERCGHEYTGYELTDGKRTDKYEYKCD